MSVALALVVAYLIGAIPVGYLVARAFGGTDIRRHGSGNIGATNVLRTLGKLPAVLTLVGDVVKGFAAVAIGRALVPGHGGDAAATAAACAVLAVIGNCWPVFLRFRGGKGVATALGVFLSLAPWATIPAAGVWLVVVWASGYVSLGSLLAAVAVPVAALTFGYHAAAVVAGFTIAAIILVRHRDNVARLLSGTERRLGQRASA